MFLCEYIIFIQIFLISDFLCSNNIFKIICRYFCRLHNHYSYFLPCSVLWYVRIFDSQILII